VREDEPLEKEVAIDPELLGKAYEKFNAIRPDNFDEFTKALKSGKKGEENKFNKKFGVYYTPREIVHYMCKQSLINYLATRAEEAKPETPITKQDIEDLIEVGEMITEHEATALIKEQNIKKGIQKSTEYTALLSDGIRNNAKHVDNWLADITVCDPAAGSGAFPVGMMTEIVRARNVLSVFLNNTHRNDYQFKRRCIEHSLYGVDIDPGAVEIAKLRLWLSLVVDEEDIKNIKPLPNLDYKIVCGNSLLSVEKDLFNQQLFNHLEKLKPLFFKETNPNRKQEYKKQINDLISQITKGHREFDFEVYFSEVFHNKGGFDVVIANPPYDVVKDEVYRKRFTESIYGRANLYGLFIHQSVKSIVKPDGFLSFINPRTLLADRYFLNLRKFLKKHGCFKMILKIADRHKVFENVLQAVIVHIFQRREVQDPNDLILIHEIREKSDIENFESRLAVTARETWPGERFDNCLLISDKQEIYAIFRRLIHKTKTFQGAGIKFETGKIQWDLFKKQLITAPVPGCVRLIWAENIQRYCFKDSERRADKEFIIGNVAIAPNIKNKTIITQRTTADEQEYRIIATVFDPYVEGFEALSENHTNYLVKCPPKYGIEFILGCLNSQLFDVIFRHINSNTQVSAGELNRLPILDVSLPGQSPIVNLVKMILAITKEDDYLQNPQKQAKVKELEREIDQLVYQLYGLTEEEIRIVEGEGK